MRIATLILFSIAASRPAVAGAQNEPAVRDGGAAPSQQRPEEIIVRGKRLADFRVEVELARERAYAVFNEINSTDDFDIQCVDDEPRTGSRMGRPVCAARFEGRIARAAAQDYLSLMRAICPDIEGLTQRCLFDPGLASRGVAAARGAESEAPTQRARLEAEIERLARTDLRFGQAILDFYDAGLKYEEERKRPREKRARERQDEP
jgi:hypothetical protein